MIFAGLYGALIWIVTVIIITIAAGKRGRNGFGYFVLSLLFSPVVGLIALATLPEPGAQEKPAQKSNHKGGMAI